MTGKRTCVVVVLPLALVGVMICILPRGVQEPVYQEKRYTEWAQQTLALGEGTAVERGRQEGIAAIEAIGTNAIPYLLQEIESKDSSVKQLLIKTMPRWSRPVPAPWRRDRAQVGFRILRRHAALFVPSLKELQKDPELAPTIGPLMESLPVSVPLQRDGQPAF